jgi:hypothetical protein
VNENKSTLQRIGKRPTIACSELIFKWNSMDERVQIHGVLGTAYTGTFKAAANCGVGTWFERSECCIKFTRLKTTYLEN